jgi:hypothetical protein
VRHGGSKAIAAPRYRIDAAPFRSPAIEHAAFTYKDKPVGTRQIGRELGVRYVLDGTAQRTGNKLRVNAQLIDAEATYIYGSSGSTATREISSPCKTRSQAGSQSPSTLH